MKGFQKRDMECGVYSVVCWELETVGNLVDPVSYSEGANVSRTQFLAREAHSDVSCGQPDLLDDFIFRCR